MVVRKEALDLARLWSANLDGSPRAVAWSPDGFSLALADQAKIRLYDAGCGEEYARLTHPGGTSSLAWSADGGLFASAGLDGTLRYWDLVRCVERAVVETGSTSLAHLAFNPLGMANGGHLLAAAAGPCIRIWEGAGKLIKELGRQPAALCGLVWKPASDELIGAGEGWIDTWQARSGRAGKRFRRLTAPTLSLALSPAGRFVATGHCDATFTSSI